MWGLVRLLLAWLGGWGCMGRLAAPARAWAGSRGHPGPALLRTRRSWVWNQFFVIEEYAGPEPVLIGKLHSDVDRGEGRTKYLLTGEGAGTVFVIDEATGNIHVTKSLDREEKAQYVLLAQAVDRASNRPLEPPSEFIIKVQDINDNPPIFPLGPYHATVPEMSNVGTSVIQVTAHDADDPSYGNSAKLVYTVLDGLPFFSVDPQTGVVRTAIPNMDRETQEEFLVVIQAKDMGGHMGGLSGSTTVTVTLSDVNDNPPKFPQSLYQFSVVETAGPGTLVGRLRAQDPDLGDNALMAYSILDGEGSEAFSISTDSQGRDGLLTVRKPLDFESRRSYTFRVEATNTLIDPAYLRRGPFKDVASVRVVVQDAPEPPAFTQAAYHLTVPENKAPGTLVGQISAADLDSPASPIRYSILPHSDPERCFSIQPEEGTIHTAAPLDREARVWHNLTVLATELGLCFCTCYCVHSDMHRYYLAVHMLSVSAWMAMCVCPCTHSMFLAACRYITLCVCVCVCVFPVTVFSFSCQILLLASPRYQLAALGPYCSEEVDPLAILSLGYLNPFSQVIHSASPAHAATSAPFTRPSQLSLCLGERLKELGDPA
ncbi:cadherin-24 isoform X2 [Macaca fascicularis]|uniref:cadherin-24 isoform X2 n=1 Tax=Macaca fascicularis TaxID=9541 RepID=UPI003D15D08B